MGEPDSAIELWLGESFESWIPSLRRLEVRTADGTHAVVEPGESLIRDADGGISVQPAGFKVHGESMEEMLAGELTAARETAARERGLIQDANKKIGEQHRVIRQQAEAIERLEAKLEVDSMLGNAVAEARASADVWSSVALRLAQQRDQVRALHVPEVATGERPTCYECGIRQVYPCATIRALGGAAQ